MREVWLSINQFSEAEHLGNVYKVLAWQQLREHSLDRAMQTEFKFQFYHLMAVCSEQGA